MPPMNGTFDATQFTPNQLGGPHPHGIYDATISNTSIEPNKQGSGGNFVVEFKTQHGSQKLWYALWHEQDGTRDKANQKLSALCHATGVFRLDWSTEGSSLRGARCKIEVGPQADKPEYSEIKKVLDAQGNEPGRAPSAGGGNPQSQGSTTGPGAQAWGVGGSAPVDTQNTAFAANTGPNVEQHQAAQQGGQNWGNPGQTQQPQANQSNQQPGWGQNTQAQPNPQQSQPNGNNQGWQAAPGANAQPQQGGNGGGNPPWGA